MALSFTRADNDRETRLDIAGRLDVMTAQQLTPTIDQMVQDKCRKVTVNLEGLDLIDSSGVAAIVALYKRIRAGGGKVAVVGARDQPLAVFKLLRMDKVFSL